MAAPTFVSASATALNTTTSPKTVTGLAVQAGDLLVILGGSENGGTTLNTPTSTGLTFTLRASQATGLDQRCYVYVWTAPIASTGSISVSVAATGSGERFGFTAMVWRAHGGVGANVSATSATSTSAPSGTLTTTGANSGASLVVADWTASTGTRTYRTPSGGTAGVEDADFSDGATWAYHSWHHLDAGAAGAKTVGMTAPAAQRWVMVGVEVLAGAGSDVTGTLSATLPKVTGAASGSVSTAGTLAASLPKVTGAVSGGVAVSGSASGTLPKLTGSITSGAVTGSVAGMLPKVTGSLPGAVRVTASTAGTLPKLTGSTAGAVRVTGSLSGQLPKVSGSVVGGSGAVTGTLSGVLPKVVGAVTGTVRVTGSTDGVLPILVAALSGGVVVPVFRFVTPTRAVERLRRIRQRPFALMRPQAETNLLKINGTYRAIVEPSEEDMVAAERIFLGGRDYVIDDDLLDELTAAGYGDWVELLEFDYGSGLYGLGRFGIGDD